VTHNEKIHLFIQWLATEDVLDEWVEELLNPNTNRGFNDTSPDDAAKRRTIMMRDIRYGAWVYFFSRGKAIRPSNFWKPISEKWKKSELLENVMRRPFHDKSKAYY